jgi:hypothetical protein
MKFKCRLGLFGLIWALAACSGACAQIPAGGNIVVEAGNPHLWSGETRAFLLDIKLPGSGESDCALQWEFVASGAILAGDQRILSGRAGASLRFPISFQAPKVRQILDGEWRLLLTHNKEIVARRSVRLRVYPAWNAQPLQQLLSRAEIAVAGTPEGRLNRLLGDYDLKCRSRVSASAVREFAGRVILLGPDADRMPALTATVLEAAAAGDTVVWFEPSVSPKGLEACNLPKVRSARLPDAVILAPGHPALAELSREDLVWENAGNASEPVMDPPESGNFRGLVGGESESPEFQLLELFPGRGRIILCQFPVVSGFRNEPGARLLFENLVRYALGEAPKFRQASLWAPPDSGLIALAKNAGIDLAERPLSDGVMIIVADSEAAVYAGEHDPGITDKIRSHLEAGGDALFIGGENESVSFLERCGLRGLAFEPAEKEIAGFRQDSPLTWGMASKPIAAATAGGEALVPYRVASDSNVTLAAAPGLIAKVRVGRGAAILCQLRVTRAPEDPAVILFFRELLTNLGVRIKS